jgi:uncharacterized protein involved in exopolysaccharide biosynthesis
MDDDVKTLQDYVAILRRRRKWLLLPMLVLFPLMVSIATLLPSVYRSSATILVEQQEIPPELVRASVTSYATQRIQLISQQVMTTRNLSGIIERFDLYSDARKSLPLELVVETMREAVELKFISAEVIDPRSGRPTEATIAFTLSFENASPDLAQQVVNELVSLYLSKNLETRSQLAAETSGFLAEEADRLSAEINDLEQKLAVFKEENAGQLPELIQVNLELMDRTERQLLEVEREIRALDQRRIEYEAQLAQTSPNAIMFSSTGERILTPHDRLRTLRAELASKVAYFSDDHPDIRRMRSEIDRLQGTYGTSPETTESQRELRSVRSALALARQQYSEEHPDVRRLSRQLTVLEQSLQGQGSSGEGHLLPTSRPDNPAYIQLQAQLRGTTTDLATLHESRSTLSTRMVGYEERLTKTPQVEREFRGLSRDYENALVKYQETKAKLRGAKMSESLERARKGERLSLIEPPLRPEQPVSPNRPAIIFLGFIFSIAGGFGAAFLTEQADPSVRDVRDLLRITNAHPLAVIRRIENRHDRRNKRIRSLLGFFIAIAFLAGSACAVHLFVVPLDVLWYSILRQLEELALFQSLLSYGQSSGV